MKFHLKMIVKNLNIIQIDHLHIPDLILKLYVLRVLSLTSGKMVPVLKQEQCKR